MEHGSKFYPDPGPWLMRLSRSVCKSGLLKKHPAKTFCFIQNSSLTLLKKDTLKIPENRMRDRFKIFLPDDLNKSIDVPALIKNSF